MELSLKYMYTKALSVDPTARIADEHLAPLNIEWIGVSSHQFATHAGFLYFVNHEGAVPDPPANAKNAFGCIVPESIADKCDGIPRIIVSDDCDFDALFTHLVNEMERVRNWHEVVNNLLVTDASYQELVEATADLVPRPMYIADASWRMISHVDFEMNEISATWHYQILHDGLYPHHIVEALNRTGDYYRISNLQHASLIDSEVYTIRILAKPIHHLGKLVGYYFMIDTWGDLGYCEVEIAEEFGNMLAPFMSARDAKIGYMSGFQDNFIFHVLDGVLTNKHDISQRLVAETHWKVDSDFRLVTVRFSPSEFHNHLLHMRTLGMLMGNFDSHAYSYRDTAIAIFHEAEKDRGDFAAHLDKCVSELKRLMVVSSRFSDFSQLKTYYDQNVYVIKRAELREEMEPRLISCDTEFRHLLADCCKNSLPNCYGADVLYAYDKEHGTSYCETLLTYLVLERNAVATAEHMFLHRNTLRNRLNKIDEILGTNFDDTDERMHLIIGLNTLLNATSGPNRMILAGDSY